VYTVVLINPWNAGCADMKPVREGRAQPSQNNLCRWLVSFMASPGEVMPQVLYGSSYAPGKEREDGIHGKQPVTQLSGLDLLLLDTQYRMHPAIANIPNKLFYDGLLKSGISAAERPPPLGTLLPPPHPSLADYHIIVICVCHSIETGLNDTVSKHQRPSWSFRTLGLNCLPLAGLSWHRHGCPAFLS